MDHVRTCIGCRSRASRSDLIRVVDQNSQLVVDERKSLPGRGAWVHPDSACIAKAISRKAFARALRVSGQPDTQTLEKRLNSYGNQVNGSK